MINYDNKILKLKANQIRTDIIEMITTANSGHPAGALGITDFFTVLYYKILKHNPKNPTIKKRDYVLISNGHIAPVLYATLANNNYFPKSELKNFRKINSTLQGHPHINPKFGIENSSGPLGQGISQSVGLAVSLKRDKKPNKVFCFTGDGELQEGQCWEAFIFAAKENLNNLIIIIDRNNIQIDGNSDRIIKLNSLSKKFSSFGFLVIEIEGNDLKQIEIVLKEATSNSKNPKNKTIIIIAKTIAGKGISYMENNFNWHGKVPNKKEKELALLELKKEKEEILWNK